jgi:manganese/zinc/iron transport system substrate-binding protein
MSRTATLLAAAAALLTLAGCGGAAEDAGDVADRKVRVTTTTNFITDTVKEVGGDRVEVTGLMGAGVDPHLYKASADDVRTLRDADVIFYGGLQLEGKMAELLSELAQRQPTKAVTDDLPRDRLLEPRAGAPANEEYDPHVWFDVGLWKQASATIAEQLIEIDPTHEDTYRKNLAAYQAELDDLDADVRERISAVPERQRLLVTSHDAFHYLGRAYDMDVAGIQGISTASEATTADIERTAKLLADRDVKAVFVESSVPKQTIDAVLAAARKRGHDAVVGGELFSDAAGRPGTPEGTYVGMVRHNAQTISEGLR